MQKSKPCPPLLAVNALSSRFAGIYDVLDDLVADAKLGKIANTTWNFNLCYCPVAAAIAALAECYGSDAGCASFAAALASWRREKMIYSFDL